jgi:hypothetical protein
VAAYDAALTVFCDFETRNTGGCDLSKAGSWRYAADPATEILCFGYRVGGVDYSWAPAMSSRDSLERLAADPAVTFVCFGGFESAVWSQIMVERHGFPPIETRRWCDLRATASSLALPRSLDKTLVAMGLPIKKDKEGQRLVRSLSKPDRKTGAYPELTPAIVERVAEYNRIDIVALEVMRGQGSASWRRLSRRYGSSTRRSTRAGSQSTSALLKRPSASPIRSWARRSRNSSS